MKYRTNTITNLILKQGHAPNDDFQINIVSLKGKKMENKGKSRLNRDANYVTPLHFQCTKERIFCQNSNFLYRIKYEIKASPVITL